MFDDNSVALSPGLALNVHTYLLIFLSILVEGLGLPLAWQVRVTEEPTEYCEFGVYGVLVIFGIPTLSGKLSKTLLELKIKIKKPELVIHRY